MPRAGKDVAKRDSLPELAGEICSPTLENSLPFAHKVEGAAPSPSPRTGKAVCAHGLTPEMVQSVVSNSEMSGQPRRF